MGKGRRSSNLATDLREDEGGFRNIGLRGHRSLLRRCALKPSGWLGRAVRTLMREDAAVSTCKSHDCAAVPISTIVIARKLLDERDF
jgi:hypothetical protein